MPVDSVASLTTAFILKFSNFTSFTSLEKCPSLFNLRRFTSFKDLASYVSFVPEIHQSHCISNADEVSVSV